MIAQHPLFVQFIVYFNENQDYFECHEVLEELWKKKEPLDKDHWLVALILLSTGLYHWRRGNRKGAEKTLQNAQHDSTSYKHFLLFLFHGSSYNKTLTLLCTA